VQETGLALLLAVLVLLNRASSRVSKLALRTLYRKSGPKAPATQRLGPPVLVVLLHYPPGAHAFKASPKIPAVWRLGPHTPPAFAMAPGSLHQQASLRAHATCRLGSPLPTAAATAPGSPYPNTSRPQGHCCHVGTRQFKPTGSAAPWEPSNCYSLPGAYTTYLRETQPPGFAIFGYQKASLLTEHGGPALPTVPDSKRALAPSPKSKNTRFPTEGRKA
jgi:hypothetical protein